MPRPGIRKPAAERKKEIADAITYAFGHWIRLEALAVLAEGKFSVSEIARAIGVSVNRLSGHIRGLYDHGCIEYMGTGRSRNADEHFYRAVAVPHITDEDVRALAPIERRESLGLVAQAIIAETLASLRAGKLDDDENARIIGRCLRVDAEGKLEVEEYLLNVYTQLLALKIQSAHRLARSDESGTTTIISVTGFERSRPNMTHGENASAREIAKGRYRKPVKQRPKDGGDAIAYAVGNPIRVEALGLLAQGKISVAEIGELLGVELKKLSDHVRHLYDYGRIEDAGTEKARNTTKHFYRAVTLPCISLTEHQVMTPAERRDVLGLIIQRIIAEFLASLRGGQLENDDTVQFIWDCLNLDKQGKQEVGAFLSNADTELVAIEELNASRLANSGETGTAMMTSLLGFERSRPGRPGAGYASAREI